MFVAPLVIGGDGVPSVGGKGWSLANGRRMKIMEARLIGGDVMIRAKLCSLD